MITGIAVDTTIVATNRAVITTTTGTRGMWFTRGELRSEYIGKR